MFPFFGSITRILWHLKKIAKFSFPELEKYKQSDWLRDKPYFFFENYDFWAWGRVFIFSKS